MQTTKDIRQIARELLRASFTDNQLDQGRVASEVDSVLNKKPRKYIKILDYYKRLLRLEAEKRHARVDSAAPLDPNVDSYIVATPKKRYCTDLSSALALSRCLLG